MKTKEVQESVSSFWQSHIESQVASGKSPAAYCRDEKISDVSFYKWRKKLFRQDSTPTPLPELTRGFVRVLSEPAANRALPLSQKVRVMEFEFCGSAAELCAALFSK